MCGICGIVVPDGAGGIVHSGALDAMAAAMVHRGPDGHGSWKSSDGQVALGHRRLSVIDLTERGRQPMSNEDQSVWVTFNGEIYNYKELRSELIKKGHTFKSESDTECLVHLYEEVGESLVNFLDGDFAFAIWDARKRQLFLARDPLGVKPLYYGFVGASFVFASELKAILAHPQAERRIDEAALYHYLTYLAVPAPLSMIRGISKLRAGESLVLEMSGRCRARKYWEPLPRAPNIPAADFDERLAELFDRSVRKRMISDVPVGVLFSGGVDSTLNALSFRDHAGAHGIDAYTAAMSGPRYADESGFAGELASKIGLNWRVTELTESELRRMIGPGGDLAARQDEPLADPVCAPLHLVTALAKRNGTTVLQAGEGADETLCGYDGYRAWMRRHERLWSPLSRLPRGIAGLAYHVLRRGGGQNHLKIADVLHRRAQGREFFISEAVGFYEEEKPSVISRGFAERMRDVDSYDMVSPYYDRIRDLVPDASFLQTLTYLELSMRLPDLLLMRADKIGMSNSVEIRVPFLDRELVEFTLSLPQDFKLRDGVSKEPYKRIGAHRLGRSFSGGPQPDSAYAKEAFYRAKKGFGAPIQDWFEGGLGDDLRDLIAEHRTDIEAFFDVSKLRSALDLGMVTQNRAFQMWTVYCFLSWKHHFKC